jgi:uncharacterized protein (UPF0303 family)
MIPFIFFQKINYEDEFKIKKILKDEIEKKKTKNNSIDISIQKIKH